MKRQNGITLIALIVTIIVMLILVGVTVNVAINGGLITVSQEAKFKTEVSQIQEALQVKKIVLASTNGGDLPQEVTLTINDLDIEEKLKTAYGTKLVIEKITDDLVLKYTNNVTEQEEQWLIEMGIVAAEAEGPGDEPFVDEFEMTLSKTTSETSGDKIIKMQLDTSTTIPEEWVPELTTERAVGLAAEYFKNMGILKTTEGIDTLEKLDVALYNGYLKADVTGNPIYDPTADEETSFPEMLPKFNAKTGMDCKNAEDFFAVVLQLNGKQYTTVEEFGASLYNAEYVPETKSVKILKGTEDVTNTVTIYWMGKTDVRVLVTENGIYTVELELDGRKSRESIEITEIYVEKTEEEQLQETIQQIANNGTVNLSDLESNLDSRWTTKLNPNSNILKCTNNYSGTEYVVTEQGRIEKATLTTAEVLEKLQITQAEGKYNGEWEVIGTDGENLKYVSKGVVKELSAPGGTYYEEKQNYINSVNILNTAAEEGTGITGAKSITLQDIYGILGNEEDIANLRISTTVHKFYYDDTTEMVLRKDYVGEDNEGNAMWQTVNTGEGGQFLIYENGEMVLIDSRSDEEQEISSKKYEWTFSTNQIEQLQSLNSEEGYWLATPMLKTPNIASQESTMEYVLLCVEEGEINSKRWATSGYSVIGSSTSGVRAVISL